MKVLSIAGEPTRYHVESASLECIACKKLFSRLTGKWSNLRTDTPCPKCGGQLDLRFHLVDVSAYWPVGQCTCEVYTFRYGPEVAKLPPEKLKALSQPEAKALRCAHIEAARTYALDATIRAHEREQLKK